MASTSTPAFCLLLVLAMVFLATEANAVYCTTNRYSPTVSDANVVVGYIRNLGNVGCCQQNCWGNYCTEMSYWYSASTRICGNCGSCISCVAAANALTAVLNRCAWNGRVSGSGYIGNFEFQLGGPVGDPSIIEPVVE